MGDNFSTVDLTRPNRVRWMSGAMVFAEAALAGLAEAAHASALQARFHARLGIAYALKPLWCFDWICHYGHNAGAAEVTVSAGRSWLHGGPDIFEPGTPVSHCIPMGQWISCLYAAAFIDRRLPSAA